MCSAGDVPCFVIAGLSGGDQGEGVQTSWDDKLFQGNAGIGKEIIEALKQA